MRRTKSQTSETVNCTVTKAKNTVHSPLYHAIMFKELPSLSSKINTYMKNFNFYVKENNIRI